MDELIVQLEKKIKQLVSQHSVLQQANHELHHGQTALAREKDALICRQEKAGKQIEMLIARLKAIENLA